MVPEVSVIIVTYNSVSKLGGFFDKVLASLKAQKGALNTELIAVDNNSTDNTVAILRGSKLFNEIIRNTKNIGLPGAYNIGYRVSKGKYVFFMNDDVILLPNSLKNLVKVLDNHPEVGVVQPIIVHLNGLLEAGFDMGLGGFVLPSKKALWELAENKIAYVNVAAGCSLMVRRESFVGFEEAFFWGYDDADFCWRMKQAGYKVAIVGDSYVVHYGSATLGKENPVKTYLSLRNQIAAYLRNQHPLLLPPGFILQLIEVFRIGVWKLQRRDYVSLVSVLKAIKDSQKLYRKLRRASNRSLISFSPTIDWEFIKISG